jgi:prolyl-tRNA synthetase
MLEGLPAIFESCGLDFNVVEADTGAIGGSSSHEFMVVADTGESAVVRCPSCGYAANVEKAETRPLAAPAGTAGDDGEGRPVARREVPTPGVTSVPDVARFLGFTPDRVAKTLLYESEEGMVAVVVRGDREVNEIKLANLLGVQHLALAGEDEVRAATGAPPGFAGPVGLADDVRLVVDRSAADLVDFVCGANKADAHLCDVDWERDVATKRETADLLLVGAGDACPRCDGTLELFRGIETGHIFKLGDKYSREMACTYTDEGGADHPMIMGCYGLGIGRTVAAAIEQNHDKEGIVWPRPLAPFEVLLAALNPDDPEVGRVAERLYGELRERGVDVFYDDRDERPGVKFKDADLVGFPVRLVVGARSLAEGKVELSLRRDREKQSVGVDEAVGRAIELLERA